MKKPLPPAAIASIAALAILILGAVFWRATSGSGEIAVEPKRAANYSDKIPDYVTEGRTPREGEAPAAAGSPR